jgi:hypothetical protein
VSAYDEYSPEGVCNLALDACGLDMTIGSLQEGSRAAQVCLRFYSRGVQQILLGALWDFARRQVDLELVADATGQTEDVGDTVPGPFTYAYAYPVDCLRLRYIPARTDIDVPVPAGNIVPSGSPAPIISNLNPGIVGGVLPTRFLVTGDTENIPDDASNEVPGISPTSRTVILSNQRYARGVYTYKAMYPNLWSATFRQAAVAFIASQIALPLHEDKKFGMLMRRENIAIAQGAINEARRTNGNESWSSSDLAVDWMRFRVSGGSGGPWGGTGPGALFGGIDNIAFGHTANSSAF